MTAQIHGLDATQTISMTREARQRLRAAAVGHEIGHGPFARVLIAEALERIDADPAFRDAVAARLEAEKLLYRKGSK